jgi:hypothetical protein
MMVELETGITLKIPISDTSIYFRNGTRVYGVISKSGPNQFVNFKVTG